MSDEILTQGRAAAAVKKLDDSVIERAVAACCQQLAELRPIVEQLRDLDRRLEQCERQLDQRKLHLPRFAEASER